MLVCTWTFVSTSVPKKPYHYWQRSTTKQYRTLVETDQATNEVLWGADFVMTLIYEYEYRRFAPQEPWERKKALRPAMFTSQWDTVIVTRCAVSTWCTHCSHHASRVETWQVNFSWINRVDLTTICAERRPDTQSDRGIAGSTRYEMGLMEINVNIDVITHHGKGIITLRYRWFDVDVKQVPWSHLSKVVSWGWVLNQSAAWRDLIAARGCYASATEPNQEVDWGVHRKKQCECGREERQSEST